MRATCRVRLLVARRSANLRTVMGAVVCWLAGGLGLALEGLVNVEEINIGSSEALMPAGSVAALAGKGLRGDRHFRADGAKPGQALTLIEAEALEDVGLIGAQSRRQVVVRGVRLNDLVGKRFRVGDVECAGVELCEPCLHLQQLTRPGIIKDLIHRGGLNADILTDGQNPRGRPGFHRIEAPRPASPRAPLNMIRLCPGSRAAA